MNEVQKSVRDYLAAIGKRGGLTKSYARQMVAIREAQIRRVENGKALTSA